MRKFVVRCPKCHHNMLTITKKISLLGISKRCVYCGKSYKVYSKKGKHRIISEVKKSG